ncbi:MAG TPA: quinate 5-dehydrogenase [Bacillota bacterium]|nr:quinate 5-dehydrogenase [Bacillota bacterium]
MKRVVSVSLGSDKRDHEVEVELLGQQIRVERRGTNGDLAKAFQLIKELDGQVDAIGLGGIDLYLFAGERRYVLRDAEKLAAAAQQTPVVDGSGLKNTLEPRIVASLQQQGTLDLRGKKVLMVSGVDRQGMARAFVEAGSEVVFGDLIFGLGFPLALRSLKALNTVAGMVIPLVSRLPFKYLYPTGQQQEEIITGFEKYYQEADIVAGDFHYIRRYLPNVLEGKTIITNTVTGGDIEALKARGARGLITTTPELKGRSFGTNVMEAMLVALAGSKTELSAASYCELLNQLEFKPRVLDFAESRIS